DTGRLHLAGPGPGRTRPGPARGVDRPARRPRHRRGPLPQRTRRPAGVRPRCARRRGRQCDHLAAVADSAPARRERAPPAVNRRSRRLLATTLTLDNAIAAPATIGLSRPAAATGIARTL